MHTKEIKKHEYTGEESYQKDRALKKETDNMHLDSHVIFLADSSPSVSNDHFLQIISTIRARIQQLHDINSRNQFTVIEFSSSCVAHARVSSNLEEILEKLPKEKTKNLGAGTNLALALQDSLIIIKNEMTDQRRKFLYILTDGFPDDKNEAIMRANDLKIANVDICCIGIGSGIDMNFIKSISPHKGYHVTEWEKLNETFKDVTVDEYDDSVRVRFSLKKRPYNIGENVKINIGIRNDSDKEIPKGTTIKFYPNSYFDVKTFKTKRGIDPEKTETLEIELLLQDSVTVKDLCENLKYSITTPSSTVIEKGSIKFWVGDFSNTLVEHTPPCGVASLNVMPIGSIGSGKSSFLNRILTLVDGLTSDSNKHHAFAITAPGGDHVTKRISRIAFSDIYPDDKVLRNLRFSVGDSYGATENTYNDQTLYLFLSGMLGEGIDMNESIMNKNMDKDEHHQIHCILFFLAQGDRGDQNLMEKLKKMYQEFLNIGYQPLVIVTKMDEVREQETRKQVIDQVSGLIGANTDLIFATENYHGGNMKNDESERNFNIDKETLTIILKAFDKGDAFIKSKKKHHK